MVLSFVTPEKKEFGRYDDWDHLIGDLKTGSTPRAAWIWCFHSQLNGEVAAELSDALAENTSLQ